MSEQSSLRRTSASPTCATAEACRIGEAVRTADLLRRLATRVPELPPHERQIVSTWLNECAEAVIADS